MTRLLVLSTQRPQNTNNPPYKWQGPENSNYLSQLKIKIPTKFKTFGLFYHTIIQSINQ
jgi:hypothetical protein